MGQNFIPDTVTQTLLFPLLFHGWLPEGHLARFLLDVVSALDLSEIYAWGSRRRMAAGRQPMRRRSIVRLLLYGYARGVYKFAKIEMCTFEDVAFRYLSGDLHTDHATIAKFRKRHLDALGSVHTGSAAVFRGWPGEAGSCGHRPGRRSRRTPASTRR